MASRPRGSSSETHINSPPRISLNDKLLASIISLPDEPHIVYSLYSPTSPSPQDYEYVESARRQLFERDVLSPLLGALLPSVHITSESSSLYVFAIISHGQIGDYRATLNALQFQGLSGEFGIFFFALESPNSYRKYTAIFYDAFSLVLRRHTKRYYPQI
jgi:hypothetical protein